MSFPKNLAAFTAPAAQSPPYISVNEVLGDRIEITVRSAPSPGHVYGPQAFISLSADEFVRLFADALNTYGLNRAKPTQPAA